MTKFSLRKEQHKGEILWALKCVMSHFAFNSSTDITDIFKAMFPDSAIAHKMKFGPNELYFSIFCGISPYFNQHLLVELKEKQCLSYHLKSHLTMNSQRTDGLLCEGLQQRQSSFQISHLRDSWSHLYRRSKERI